MTGALDDRKFLENLDRADEDARAGAARGIALAAEHLLGASRQLVPHDEGDLERSGTVSTDGLAAAVSYDTPYAVVQHEDTDYVHKSGREAKYLETPMHSERDAMLHVIAQTIKQEIGL